MPFIIKKIVIKPVQVTRKVTIIKKLPKMTPHTRFVTKKMMDRKVVIKPVTRQV